MPQHLFAGTSVELRRQTYASSADIPKQDAERVDVDAVVVSTSEQLRGHVDRCSDDASGHHRLRFTKAKVGQLPAIVFVQLEIKTVANL